MIIHDKNGQELKEGDLVIVPCRITRTTGDGYRGKNIEVMTVDLPQDGGPSRLELSSLQVTKAIQLPPEKPKMTTDPSVEAKLAKAREETAQINSYVRCKETGQLMLVHRADADNVLCRWLSDNGEPMEALFPRTAVYVVDPPKPTA